MSRTFKKFKVAEKSDKSSNRSKRPKNNNWVKGGKKRAYNIEFQDEEV